MECETATWVQGAHPGDKLPMSQDRSTSLQTCMASISLQANPLFPGPVGPPESTLRGGIGLGVCLLCFFLQCSALPYFSTGIFHVMSRSYFHRSYFHKISPYAKSTEGRRICFLSFSKMWEVQAACSMLQAPDCCW